MSTGVKSRCGAETRILETAAGGIRLRPQRNARARRMTLRIDPSANCAVLTLPTRVSLAQGLDFARSKAGWLVEKLAELPPLTPFRDDVSIPFLGCELLLRHFPLAGTRPLRADGVLYVPGPEIRLGDTVKRWLATEARREVTQRAEVKAAQLGQQINRVRISDPRTRWGSCSSSGTLSFSWRLVMAPEAVLDYVVAHEVAHLEELNHSPAFKAVLATLTANAQEASAWLARNGSGLLRYG